MRRSRAARMVRVAFLPIFQILVAAALAAPTLGQPLLEAHGFRQTQTAYAALVFHEQGIDLMRPQIPVFGPPWVVPFEFPLFQAGAAVLMDLGLSPDVALRTLGLACFLLTGWLLNRLANRMTGQLVANVSLAAFLFSPFGILWGRTSMVEYMATAGGLGFLLAGMKWREGSPLAFPIALLFGAVGALTKSTTGLVYLLPILAYRRGWRDWRTYALIGAPALLSFAWTAYADAVKASTEATAWLTTAALRDWYFGTLVDRADPAAWAPILRTLTLDMTGLSLAVSAPLALVAARRAPFVLAFLGSALIPILVVMPMYTGHTYYLAAISPIVALSVGLSVAWLWRRRARLALVGFGAAWVAASVIVADHWLRVWWPVVDPSNVLPAAEYIAAHTEPDDVVAIEGRGWHPGVWYYARRRGVALDEPKAAAVGDAVSFRCPYVGPCEPLDR